MAGEPVIISNAINYFSDSFLKKECSVASSEILVKQLSACPQSKALLEEAQQVIKELALNASDVHFEQPTSGHRAETQGNIIRIDPKLPASEQRYLLIFELTNIIQLKTFAETAYFAKNGTAEDFIRAMEHIEYNGLIRAQAIGQAINKEKRRLFKPYIEVPSPYLPLKIMGFNLYYRFFVSNKHKETHRRNWKVTRNMFHMPDDKPCTENANGRMVGIAQGFALTTIFAIGVVGNLYRAYTLS